jgi:monoamine oxidase
LNDALEHGIVRNEFIEKGFNLEQWNRKLRKQKKPELSVEERNRITAEIREFLAGFSC